MAETSFEKLLRDQCDQIMTITGADPELPYSELAAHVRAWAAGEKYVMIDEREEQARALDDFADMLRGIKKSA